MSYEEEAHPAYQRILGDLAPDDARILRFLARRAHRPRWTCAPQDAGVTSEMVAPGLSMIGAEAGCRYLDRVPAYLNNLYRLGLIWFSREALSDPLRYQVLEAQPEVAEAMDGPGAAEDRAPEHPPDAVRRGLLSRVPPTRGRGHRLAA